MSVKVQKYIANLGKSVAYTTADVLSEKFTYVNDFKNENREVFNEVYHSVKDYRTTFARLKKTITNNKFVDAARVGYDSIVYSVTTGDFYAKQKEQEVIEKYGGTLMEGMDIDDEEFDFENRDDVSEGDMVIATAVKKNSKIQTAITTEAIVKTGKAQMDSNKENTMMLYVQNERLMNKLDGGLQNILGVMKQNAEQQSKVQNKMNENLNKFMTNVDNNLAKLTAQMDELLQMQRNMYNPQKAEEKKRGGRFDDIVDRGGVINLKAYGAQVKKQTLDTLMDTIPGLNMLIGDGGLNGSNMLAQMAANPTRELSKTVINKILGKKFDEAAQNFNKTLENAIPDIMAKLYAQGKKEGNGIKGLLGKIFGLKPGQSESINTGNYNKGAIPFDGITKKSIVEVIPYYLRKMTSAITGGEEMTFDFQTGRWTSMKAAKIAHDKIINAERDQVMNLIKGELASGTGRSFDSMYATKQERDYANDAVQSLSLKLAAAGDISAINESDLNSRERAIFTGLKKIWKRSVSRKEEDIYSTVDGKKVRYKGASPVGFASALRNIKNSHNAGIKQLNDQGGIAMLIASEGIGGEAKDYHGKSYVDSNGDMSQRHIQEMPVAQVLLRAKDEYGATLFDYLRSMGGSLNYIKGYSTYLQVLPFINNSMAPPSPGSNNQMPEINIEKILNEDLYKRDKDSSNKYALEYYRKLREKAKKDEQERYEKAVADYKNRAQKKGKSLSFITNSTEYQSQDNEIGMSRLVSDRELDYETDLANEIRKEEAKKQKEKWKKIEEFAGKEAADKLKKADAGYDDTKGLRENLAKVSSTSEKILVMGKWFSQKSKFNAIDKATETIVKTDQWLKNLIYGEDIKPEDEKKSLWQLMKDHTQNFFNNVQKKIDDFYKKIQESEFYKKFFGDDGMFTKAKKKVFGEVDSEGNILEEGLLSHFTAGFRKGMANNTDDVHKMWKKEIEEAKKLLGNVKTEFTESTSTTSSQPTLTPSQKRAARKSQIVDKIQSGTSNSDEAINRQLLLNQYQITQGQNTGVYNGPIRTDTMAQEGKAKAIAQAEADVIKYQNALEGHKRALTRFQNEGAQDKIANQLLLINRTEDNLKKAQKRLESIKSSVSKVRGMYAGGINKTGKPFKSVISAGEYLNGSKINNTGIYTVPKDGVVINPAPAYIRNIQARNEKNFIKRLSSNAEANDNLEPVRLTDEQRKENQQKAEEAKKRIEQVDLKKLGDWQTLTDDKQRAAFLSNMASRGVLGGAAGLLVGGPLLGAAVGAASSLTKSTGSFAQFLFGDVEKDPETGEVILDAKGNPKRKDTGLVSKELQKAAPEMTKLGMAGMAAGLLTPLGPLGGMLIGTGLGFAKNSEVFQGTLFGEGGILTDERIDSLKKGAKNMGIGAATAALFLPGPFGLVGSALIGATAGYVTSTDKFKDFLLGEEIDGKRRGGVRGALKDNLVDPLKGFGRNMVDKIMDEVFGPEGDDGQRNTDKGLFGAIRSNVIRPMTQGAQSIFKELTNTVSDIKDFTLDTIEKLKRKMAGDQILQDIFGAANKVGTFAIGAAGKVGRAATTPFRLLGDEGIGGKLKSKRVQKGRANDMTALERLQWRGKAGLAETDEYSSLDNFLVDSSTDDIDYLQALLRYDQDKGKINNTMNNAFTVLGQGLRDGLVSPKDSKIIIKYVKKGEYKKAEKHVNTLKISPENKKEAIKLINETKKKIDKAREQFNAIKANGDNVQKFLKDKGINLDITNKRHKKTLDEYITRELAHKDLEVTDEEQEFLKERQFWTGKGSPLETVNSAATGIEKTLNDIYYSITVGNDYDKLSDEAKANFNGREDYIAKRKKDMARNAIANAGEDYAAQYDKNLGKVNTTSIKEAKFGMNDWYEDYLPFWTGNLKDAYSPDNRLDKLKEDYDEVITKGCQTFDGKVIEQLGKSALVMEDLENAAKRIMNRNKNIKDIDTAKAMVKLLKRIVTIDYNGRKYEFEVVYKLSDKGDKIIPCERQLKTFNEAKARFVEEYVKDHVAQIDEKSWMSMGDMIKQSLKSGFYIGTGGSIPIFIRDYIKSNAKHVIDKAVKFAGDIKFKAHQLLGDHGIDETTNFQKIQTEAYQEEANLKFERLDKEYAQGKENAVATLNAIAKEMNLAEEYSLLSDEDKARVRDRFISNYVKEKKDKQIVGRGLYGDIKQMVKNTKLAIKKKFANLLPKRLKNALTEDPEEIANRKKKEINKKANEAFDKIINGEDEKGKKMLEKIIIDAFGGRKTFGDLTTEDIDTVRMKYVEAYEAKAFDDWLYGGDEYDIPGNARKWLESKIISLGTSASNKLHEHIIDPLKKLHANRRKEKELIKALNYGVVHDKDRLESISQELYQTSWDDLAKDDKNPETQAKIRAVAEKYNEYFKSKGGRAGFALRKANKWFTGVKDKVGGKFNDFKSGVKNKIAGGLEKAKENTWIGKAFSKIGTSIVDRLEAARARREKASLLGKKDSKLAKIIKWIFIGGVAVPIIVGFVKDKLMPAIHEKIQPWLKNIKDKLFGKKNETTDEYEGGIISGIVNPIRNFFKDKFQKIHDWFHNEGEFTSPDTGMKGVINNIKGVGVYIMDLWKSGANTIINDYLPGIVEGIVVKLPDILWSVGKGIVAGIGALFAKLFKKDDNGTGAQDVSTITADSMMGVESKGGNTTYADDYGFNNTVGSKISVTPVEKTIARPNYNFNVPGLKGLGNASTTRTVNEDGTVTLTNDDTGASVTSEIIDDADMISYGKNDSGATIYYKRSDTHRTQPYTRASNGQYVRLDKQRAVMDAGLQGNAEYEEMLARAEAGDAGEVGLYTGTNSAAKNRNRVAKELIRAGTDARNAKGLGLFLTAIGKGSQGIGKAIAGKGPIVGSVSATRKGIGGLLDAGGKFLAGNSINAEDFAQLTDLAESSFGKLSRKQMKALRSGSAEAIEKAFKGADAGDVKAISELAEGVTHSRGANFATSLHKGSQKLLEKGLEKSATLRSVNTAGLKIKGVNKAVVDKVGGTALAKGAKSIVEMVKELFKKAKSHIVDMFKKLFASAPFKKVLKESGKEVAEETLEKTAKECGETLVKEASEKGAKEIAEAAGKNAVESACDATGIGVVVNIAFAVADFLAGVDDARNILQITDEKVDPLYRIFAGLANTLQDIPVVGIVFGVIGAKNIVWFLVDVLGKVLFPKLTEDLRNKQEASKEALEAYNTEHNTHLTMEEYNNRFNATIVSKIGGGIKSAGAWMAGRDATVSAAMDTREVIEAANKKIEKTRNKLQDIASHMWEKQGKIFKGFGLDKYTYGEACAEVIEKIVIMLNGCNEDEIKSALDSAGKMRMNLLEKASNDITRVLTIGLVDQDPFNKAWKDGYKGISYLGLDEEKFENTDVIKAIGGITSVFCKSVEGANIDDKIKDIVISIFANVLTKKMDSKTKELIDSSNENIGDINSEYVNNTSNKSSIATSGVSDEQQSSKAAEDVATNANANDKLTPLSQKALDKIMSIKDSDNPLFKGMQTGFEWFTNGTILGRIGQFMGKIIHTAIQNMTGGFDGIEDFFKGMKNKNKAINESIDNLSLLPTNKEFWKINIDNKNPFMGGLFNFVELMNRTIKAPFALAAGSLSAGMDAVQNSSSASDSSSGGSNSGTQSAGTDNTASSGGGLLSGLISGAKKAKDAIGSFIGGLFGKGKDDKSSSSGYGNDPYHIYQRAYSGSFSTSGDREHQTIADSGCGPASAASVLRMYGQQGDMRNAVNYALGNKYKEVNGGTYPQYFNDYLNKHGIKTNSNANNKDVVQNLAQGKPVILMGRDAKNSGRTPYGSKYSHYVVARGLDRNGNVIVEDSEDKNGSTRYSLAETLSNSSVKITTGRGAADKSLASKYIGGVSALTTATLARIATGKIDTSVNTDSSGSTGNTGSTGSTGSTPSVGGNASTNGTIGSLKTDSDVKTKCGYTADQLKAAIDEIHPEGCSASQFPEHAINVEGSHGINALFTVSVAIQENGWNGFVGINTTHRNKGNYNVFNMQGSPNSSNGRWKDFNSLAEAFAWFGQLINGNTYYGGGAKTPAQIGNIYCPPNAAENAGFSPWGEAVCKVAGLIEQHISKSGTGKNSLFESMNKKLINNVIKSASKLPGSTGSNGSSSTNNANGSTGNSQYSGNISGDAQAALGKSLSMSDNYGNSYTITVTQDEVDLYSMLTMDCGLSHAAACGALGNWEVECYVNKIRSTATKGVIAYGGGIMQWTPGSKHTNWASSHGFSDVWSWEANIAHAKDDILNGGNWSNPGKASPSLSSEGLTAVSSFDEFKNLADPESAAVNFERVYEVSGDWNGKNSEGVKYTENRLRDRQRRLCAKILYELIKSGSGNNGQQNAAANDTANDATTTGTGRGKGGNVRVTTTGRGNTPVIEFERPTTGRSSGRRSTPTSHITNNVSKVKYGRGTTYYKNEPTTGFGDNLVGFGRAVIKSIMGRAKTDNKNNTTNKTNNAITGNTTVSAGGNRVIQAVCAVIKAYEAAGIVGSGSQYSQSKHVTLDFGEGETFSARPDCTGLIDSVLEYMGYDSKSRNSTAFVSCTEITSYGNGSKNDWQFIDNPSISDIQPGDIVVLSGHGEIAAFQDSGKVYGWNYGSDNGMAKSLKAVNLQLGGMDPAQACVQAGAVINGHGHYDRIIRYLGINGTTGRANDKKKDDKKKDTKKKDTKKEEPKKSTAPKTTKTKPVSDKPSLVINDKHGNPIEENIRKSTIGLYMDRNTGKYKGKDGNLYNSNGLMAYPGSDYQGHHKSEHNNKDTIMVRNKKENNEKPSLIIRDKHGNPIEDNVKLDTTIGLYMDRTTGKYKGKDGNLYNSNGLMAYPGTEFKGHHESEHQGWTTIKKPKFYSKEELEKQKEEEKKKTEEQNKDKNKTNNNTTKKNYRNSNYSVVKLGAMDTGTTNGSTTGTTTTGTTTGNTNGSTTTGDTNSTSTKYFSNDNNSNASGLLTKLGNYATKAMRSIFGDAYDALVGNSSSNSGNTGSNNGTNSGSNDGSINGSANDPGDADGRMKALFQLFTSSGFSDNLAAGVLGNIRGESNFDPHVVEGGGQGNITTNMGHGYGIIQWTGAASRAALYNWCKKNGCDPESLDGQGKWVVAQMKGINIQDEADSGNSSMFGGKSGEGTMSYNWNLIQKQGSFQDFCSWSLEQCVELFLKCVERPANISGALPKRVQYAQEVLSKCGGSGNNGGQQQPTALGKFGRGKVGSTPTKFYPGRSSVPFEPEGKFGRSSKPSNNVDQDKSRNVYDENGNVVAQVDLGQELAKQQGKTNNGSSGKKNNGSSNGSSGSSGSTGSVETVSNTESADSTGSTTTGTTDANGQQQQQQTSNASGLLGLLGSYTTKLMKGMFGDFYDALFGNSSSGDNGNQDGSQGGNQGAATGDASTVFGAVQIVVKAYEQAGIVGNSGDYNQGGKTVSLSLNGKSYNGRPDCTGLCDSVIECMGYNSESMNSSAFNSCQGIRDSSGNISSDWQLIDSPQLSDVQPGDICIIYAGGAHHGEICAGSANGKLYGWNYGYEGGMAKALQAVNAQMSGTDALQACVDAGSTINGHGSYTRLIRYVGNGANNQQQQQDQSGQPQDQNGGTPTALGYGRGKGSPVSTKSIVSNNASSFSDKYGRAVVKRSSNYGNYLETLAGRNNSSLAVARQNNSFRSMSSIMDTLGSSNSVVSDEQYNTNSRYFSNDTASTFGNNKGTENLTEMLRLMTTIAGNSEKMDSVLEALNTIASNTGSSVNNAPTTDEEGGYGRARNSSVPKHQKVNRAFNNGLSALRKSFDSDNTGEDIIKAVYQIAKS